MKMSECLEARERRNPEQNYSELPTIHRFPSIKRTKVATTVDVKAPRCWDYCPMVGRGRCLVFAWYFTVFLLLSKFDDF
jgi:hypothetical protein